MIEKMKKIVTITLLLVMSLTVNAINEKPFNWDKVVEAIIQVESEGHANAVNGNCVGYMQISPGLVKECNKILKQRGNKKHFALADRYNKAKSKEMFILMQSQYNKHNNIEKAIKSWNGGINYKNTPKIQKYYRKVLSKLK